jgi:Cu2+-exporting ATPase
VWTVSGAERNDAEPVLLALEMHSAHPLAEAVTGFLSANGYAQIPLDTFENISGKGVKARHGTNVYAAGNLKFMEESGVQITAAYAEKIQQWQETGSVVCFSGENRLLAIIALADAVKPSSQQAIQKLQQRGIEVHMLTGDNAHTAEVVAHATGIRHFSANLLPADKAAYVSGLQAKGHVVAMAGDGINDSQALAQADVSIAMGRGSDIAMDVAGMTLVSSDLRQIVKAFSLSAMTVRTIHQNLFWAFIYNLIGIPVAAGILYPWWFIMLNTMIAAAAMALSSVSVVSNSLRLRTKKL